MVKDHVVGYRFSPSGEELIKDDAISEINICSCEPKDLPPLYKIKSDDHVWYFFSPKVYANVKKTTLKRTIGSELWKPLVKDSVGYRFSPTGEDLINYYLKNKILGNSWLVDDAISEINICSYNPIFLPSFSKIKSDDLKWYFFSPIEYANVKKKTMKRKTTGSGFWKPIVKDRIIKDRRRGNNRKIGIKKKLVYHEGKFGNGVPTPWVMHEYHITCLPPTLTTTHVLCKVKYQIEVGDTFEE